MKLGIRKKPIAIISGASRGLGKELVKHVEKMGFEVIKLGFKTEAKVDFRFDLSDKNATLSCIEQIRSEKGDVSLLIANAGTGKSPEWVRSEEELKEFFFTTNFIAARNIIESATESLKRTSGHIIAISSIVALKKINGAPEEYADSKRLLNEYIREYARENGKFGIRANLISPGNIFFKGSRWEELLMKNRELVKRKLKDEVPLGNFITPKEIAGCIQYLNSKTANNITGANIVIDGGQSL